MIVMLLAVAIVSLRSEDIDMILVLEVTRRSLGEGTDDGVSLGGLDGIPTRLAVEDIPLAERDDHLAEGVVVAEAIVVPESELEVVRVKSRGLHLVLQQLIPFRIHGVRLQTSPALVRHFSTRKKIDLDERIRELGRQAGLTKLETTSGDDSDKETTR